MFKLLISLACILLSVWTYAQSPTPFNCSGSSQGFGYYIASETENNTPTTLSYSNSRLSRITTSTGTRTTVCTPTQMGRSLNGLAFNPHDNFLYAVSRYDPNLTTGKSGRLYRIGSNCQLQEVSVTGSIIKFDTNDKATIDAAGGNIGSGTFDLDNNYYVNTSFTNQASTGFTNKIQIIRISSTGATVLSTQTLTCASCTGELRITDIIFDEASNSLLGHNFINKRLYKINASTGVLTPITPSSGTGLTSPVLGMYKNKDGMIRAITEAGQIYNVNATTGTFTLISTVSDFRSRNADAASGCYAPPSISGHLYLDSNRLTDGTVNGTGTDKAGSTKMYANLIIGGLVDKSSEILPDGTFQFLGLFSGTYTVEISSSQGTIGQAPPAQNLPSSHEWVGDNIGAGVGNDGTPDGRLGVTIASGSDVSEVNFGIDMAVTVPLDFTSFTGKLSDQYVLLSWTTENELNNDFFEIQKSTNNLDFKTIGKVYAGTKYELIDRNVVTSKIAYYRLKQVDIDGSIMYSNVISIHRKINQSITVQPTLFSDLLTIYFNDPFDSTSEHTFKLYDLTGRMVGSERIFEGENAVDVSKLQKGIYYYTIVDQRQTILQTDKLIKP
ncbi:DUF6923 family protein [Portibacter marinus]|uniref:DUF6923 family protein n=1 Tax=Portibacter marinus TaxID=2898660 RepID=UPI001F2BE0A9|nr:T9SS type A sorting domain-containing protein [Portibacter marinus]